MTYGGAVISFTLIYRLSPFHPLAKYPGPAIAKTSKLWAAYLCAKGDLTRHCKCLHDRYGDVVRLGKRQSQPSPISGCSAANRAKRAINTRFLPHTPGTRARGPSEGFTYVCYLSAVACLRPMLIRLGGSSWTANANCTA